MHKLLVFTTLVILLASSLCAQPTFAPLGTRWKYEFNLHNGGLRSDYEVRVVHDTLIGATQVKTLARLEEVTFSLPPQQFYSDSSYFGTLSYRNDSVFMTGCSSGTNGYLFDFEMKIGDSIPMWAPGGMMQAVVVGRDSVLVGAVPKQRWHLDKFCDGNPMGQFQIIEEIGPVDEFLAYNHEGCNLGIGWWVFQCFASPTIVYNQPCPPVVLTASTPTQSITWSLAPNPATDRIQLVSSGNALPAKVTIFDLQGRTQWVGEVSGQTGETISLAHLQAGLYFVRIDSDGLRATQSLVILK